MTFAGSERLADSGQLQFVRDDARVTEHIVPGVVRDLGHQQASLAVVVR
jgi:hypothetical protein